MNKFGSKFRGMASVYTELSSQTYDCEVEAQTDKDEISKQLSSLYILNYATKWHELFLTQALGKGLTSSPSNTATDISPKTKQELLQRVVTLALANDEKRATIENACTEMIAGAVKVNAPAGTRKTAVSSTVAKYFFDLGIHVLGIAPSNSACDRHQETSAQLYSDLSRDRQPIRFYREVYETAEIRNYASEERPLPKLKQEQQNLIDMLQVNVVKFALEVEVYEDVRQKDKTERQESGFRYTSYLTLS